MKNEKDFKKRISEIAAKIAGIKEYDQDKIDLPDSIKAKINSSITNQKDLALFLIDIMKEIIANEPGMSNIENMAWKDIVTLLKRKAGLPTGNDNKNLAYDGMPVPKELQGQVDKLKQDDIDAANKLKENYERIKRK